MNSSRIFQSLGDEEGLRVLLGDSEEFEGGLTKAARTLLSTEDSVEADVQEGSEVGLAGLQRRT